MATTFSLHKTIATSEIWGKFIIHLLIIFIFKYYSINLKYFLIIDSQYSQTSVPLLTKNTQIKIYLKHPAEKKLVMNMIPLKTVTSAAFYRKSPWFNSYI